MAALGVAALSLGAVACGDDDDDGGDGNVTPDASTADAAPPPDAGPPDGAPAVSNRSGLIAVADVELLGSAGDPADNWSGGSIIGSWDAVPSDDEPEFSNVVPPGIGCTVQVYDFTADPPDAPPTSTEDEGPFSVEAPDTGDSALLAPMGPCDYNDAAQDYLCVFGGGAVAVGDSLIQNADGTGGNFSTTANVNLANATFDTANTPADEIGMWLSLSGFPDVGGNPSPCNGEFPILGVVDADTAVILFPAPNLANSCTVATAGPGFAVVSGAGPTPVARPFLSEADPPGSVQIDKEASDNIEAFTASDTPGGIGFVLDVGDTSASPLAFPADGAVTFGCSVADDECGAAEAMVVFGSARAVAEAGDLPQTPFVMPADEDTTKLITFACTALAANSITLPDEAADLIRDMEFGRIQTSVLRGNLIQVANANLTNGTNALIGFGFAGHTTIAPAP